MHGSKHRRVVAGVAAVVGGLVLAVVAWGDAVFTDLTGDATGGAPDITQVAASNDAAGLITFRVTTVAPIVNQSIVGVDLDTDSSPANGAEFVLIAGLGGSGLLKWDGTQYVDAGVTIVMTRSGNVIEFRVNRSDLGNPTKFGFDAVALLFDTAGALIGQDSAPDGGEYSYALVLPQCANGKDDDGDGKIDADDLGCSSAADNLESDDPVTLAVGKPVAVPAKPRAGKAFAVSVAVTRVETGSGIPSGTAKCAGRVGTTALKGVGKVVAGRAACAFKLPAGAKGKTARGTITVTYLGKTKTVPFSFKVS